MHIIPLYTENHEFLLILSILNPTSRLSLVFSCSYLKLSFLAVRNITPIALKYPVTALPTNPQTPSSSCLGSDTCARSHPCTDATLIQHGFTPPHPALSYSPMQMSFSPLGVQALLWTTAERKNSDKTSCIKSRWTDLIHSIFTALNFAWKKDRRNYTKIIIGMVVG